MGERWEVLMPRGYRWRRWLQLPWGWIALGVVLLWLVLTSFFTVESGEVGLILRFGKFVREVGPGLHWKFPFGVERVYKFSTERIFKEEFGFRTRTVGERTEYGPPENSEEPVMLTGDLSIVHVEWVVQYRIADPFAYRFRIADPKKTLRDISQAVVRKVVGDRTVDEVLTYGREEVADEVRRLMQAILDAYGSGIRIETVRLQNVQPPDPVKPAFHGVNQAKQEQERLINEAWEAYNRAIPQAEGEAKQTIAQAEGYAIEVVNRARGDADRFRTMLEEYRRAPDVTRQRILLETLAEVLPHVQQVLVVDPETRSLIPLLSLPAAAGGKKASSEEKP